MCNRCQKAKSSIEQATVNVNMWNLWAADWMFSLLYWKILPSYSDDFGPFQTSWTWCLWTSWCFPFLNPTFLSGAPEKSWVPPCLFLTLIVCWKNVSTWQMCGLKNQTELPLTPHIFSFRFCEMCHGLYSKVYYHWTQGSAALCMGSKSLVSFVSFFSLCCFLTCYTSL